MKQKTFYRKPARPIHNIKPAVRNSTIEFTKSSDMITQQEYDEAYKGNVSIKEGSKAIMNLNAPLPNFPTGTRQKLYAGRGPYLEAKHFLEM